MCLTCLNSASQLLEVVASTELPFFVLADINYNRFTLDTQQQIEPTSRYGMPVVLMHDHCEDG